MADEKMPLKRENNVEIGNFMEKFFEPMLERKKGRGLGRRKGGWQSKRKKFSY